jgi:hypothetical protein
MNINKAFGDWNTKIVYTIQVYKKYTIERSRYRKRQVV